MATSSGGLRKDIESVVNLLGYGGLDDMSEHDRKEETHKRAARGSFKEYMKLMYPGYIEGDHLDLLIEKLEAVERGDLKRLIVSIPPRHALADSTPVITPDRGYVAHGDLRVGDAIYGADGSIISVTDVMPKVGMDYVVRLSNGDDIVCNSEHIWEVKSRGSGDYRAVSTEEMVRRGVSVVDGGKVRHRFGIRAHGPLEGRHADLPLHPYALGAWLGDGSANHPRLSMDPRDRAVSERIQELGYNISSINQHPTQESHESIYFSNGRSGRGPLAPFAAALRSLGVKGDKHIPDIYIRSSVQQRLELLAGVMDTDGHVEAATGRCRIVSTSRKIIDGMFEVCQSLGFRPYINDSGVPTSGFGGKRSVMTLGFQPTMPIPTVLPRKTVERFAKQRQVSVVAIDPYDGGEVGNCISVSADDGLYLVGNHQNITHNSKSMHISEGFPAWYLGRNPESRIIAASHTQRLADIFSRRVRGHIQSPSWPFQWVSIGDDSAALRDWELGDTEGGYLAAGVGTGITGRGANLMIIDDPHKDMAEAESPVMRENVHEWFSGTLYTRRQPGAAIIIVMTRWHADDLVGRLLERTEQGGEDWDVVNLPAENQDGSFLWEEYWPPEEYELAKKSSTRVWNAQYMGRPSTEGGNMLREQWFGRYAVPAQYSRVVVAYDTAEKVGLTNDYTACTVIGVKPNGYDLLVVTRSKVEFPELIREIDNRMAWASASFPEASVELVIEDASSGTAVIQLFKSSRNYVMYPVSSTRKNEKEIRVMEITPLVETGRVSVPEVAPWIADFFSQITQFPYDTHDDVVDSFSIGLRHSAGIGASHGGEMSVTRYNNDDRDYGELSYKRRNDRLRGDR